MFLAGATSLFTVAGVTCVGCGGSFDCNDTATCSEPATDATQGSQDVVVAADGLAESSDAGGADLVVVEAIADGAAAVRDAPGEDAAGERPDECGLTEDCSNGIDDNCDGKIDCADPQCMPAYSCTPAFPPGWNGPVAFVEQDTDAAAPIAPPCPSAYPTLADDGHATLTAPIASCQCTCQGPCSLTVSTFTNNNCGGTHLCAATTVATNCTPAAGACAVQTAKITTGVAFTGCTAGVQKNVPPFGWATASRVCATRRTTYFQGGCGAGQVCADTPPLAFARGLCVYQSGTLSCPTSGYTVAHSYYQDAGDSRDCDAGACQCNGPSSGSACSATNVTVSATSNCSNGTVLSGSCGSPFPVTSSPYIGATLAYPGGSCTPTGTATPTGFVEANAAATVCCTN
jgi:hypothetical protein